jgi:hypothetical protein
VTAFQDDGGTHPIGAARRRDTRAAKHRGEPAAIGRSDRRTSTRALTVFEEGAPVSLPGAGIPPAAALGILGLRWIGLG